jgi:FeS assembly SUF system protein
MKLEQQIIKTLKTIRDPEIPVNIYDLGLIYGVEVQDSGDVKITMTLTAPNCPVAEILPEQVRSKVAALEGVKHVEVKLTFDPPWNQGRVDELIKLSLGI